MQLPSMVTTHNKCGVYQKRYSLAILTTLNNAFETEFAQDKGYESESEGFNIPTPLSRALRVYHISTMEELSFNPANFGLLTTTPEHHEEYSPQGYRCSNLTCHQLVFTSSDDVSPVRAVPSSPEHHNLCHYYTPTPNKEQFFTVFNNVAWDDNTTSSKENFPTAPLYDLVWSEDSIPERHLCIHKTPHEPYSQCSFPCPYRNTTFRRDLP